ncbi:MAG: glycosyltransferase [Clostridia bacterium]|nr:glycosyltransferase [Clostridia bacterium]
MSNVRFTVNVPVYNAEKYLHECIDSVLNQTFTDFELLLIDDGSTDSSGAICDEYAKKDSRVKVFHNKNQGSFATRFFAVKHASGEYCSFCDSDDYFDACYLERANELISKEQCDMLVFRHEPVTDGVRQYVKPYWDNIRIFEGDGKKEFYVAMMTGSSFNSLNIKFTRTELLQNDTLDFKKYSFVKNGDDFLQSLYPVFNAEKIVFAPECYYNYRTNPDSLTHKVDPNIYNSIFAVRSVIWENYLKGTDILGEDTQQVFAMRSARSAMNIVKLIAQSDNLADEEKIEIFRKIHSHDFYRDFIEPNLVKTDLEKKWQFVYELFSRHSYKLLLSTVRMLTKIKK